MGTVKLWLKQEGTVSLAMLSQLSFGQRQDKPWRSHTFITGLIYIHTDRHPHIYTDVFFLTQNCVPLDCGRKPEYMEGPQAQKEHDTHDDMMPSQRD